MSVRPQAMHLSFVVLSWSTRVGRERHQDATASRPTPLLLPPRQKWLWVYLGAFGGSFGAARGALWGTWLWIAHPAVLHAHAHSHFSARLCSAKLSGQKPL